MNERIPRPRGVPSYGFSESASLANMRDVLLSGVRRAGYHDIELPVFEYTDLYIRGVGESTDVVTKEMYTFADKSGRSLTLRPEGTAGVARGVIEHALDKGTVPVRACYSGPFFRYERPQKGRYRQLQQMGIECIGTDDPSIDAEVIYLAYDGLASVGLKNFRLEISSLGGGESRAKYHNALLMFLQEVPLDEETRARVNKNPLRIFDSKSEQVKDIMLTAPSIRQYLSVSEEYRFNAVLKLLDAMYIPYTVNQHLVRGLDYYTQTVFEFVVDDLGTQSGVCGGGGYAGLMHSLGGNEAYGVGFGIGLDRVMLALSNNRAKGSVKNTVDVYVNGHYDTSISSALILSRALRREEFRVEMNSVKESIKSALRSANRLNAKVAVIPKDNIGAAFIIKNMDNGDQVCAKYNDALEVVVSFLKGEPNERF